MGEGKARECAWDVLLGAWTGREAEDSIRRARSKQRVSGGADAAPLAVGALALRLGGQVRMNRWGVVRLGRHQADWRKGSRRPAGASRGEGRRGRLSQRALEKPVRGWVAGAWACPRLALLCSPLAPDPAGRPPTVRGLTWCVGARASGELGGDGVGELPERLNLAHALPVKQGRGEGRGSAVLRPGTCRTSRALE